MSQTILLTGISGFIAKRIAHDLLAKGYNVRGTVRSMGRTDEVRAAVGPEGLDRLSFVEADLTSDAGWDAAMEGVDAVLHTASPFPMATPKDENDIIRPAVDGTLRALRAAQKAGVTRVVVTSSMASIMYVERAADHGYGPDDWTDLDHPAAIAYVKSKTMAERAAWDFAASHPEMQLTAVNPGLVCGTPMDAHYGTSLELVERVLAGKDPMIPNLGMPIVDIADVSALHIAALGNPDTIGKRLIAAEDFWMMPKMAQTLKAAYPERKIATRIAPKFMLKLLSLFDPAIKSVLPQIGMEIKTDNSTTRDLLDFTFVPAKDALLASAKYVVETKS